MNSTMMVGVIAVLLAGPLQLDPADTEMQDVARGSLRGVVVDQEHQTPLSGAKVLVDGTTISATTDRVGVFAIADVPRGDYVVDISCGGYVPVKWKDVRVRENREVYLMVALRRVAAAQSTTGSEGLEMAGMLEDTVYREGVDRLPQPVGGISELMRKVRYPEMAVEGSIEGTVYVEAFINESGAVDRVRVVKAAHKLLDSTAVDAVKATRFVPGTIEGKAVKTRIAIPIRFRLSAGEKKKQ